jgi:hypothetical protein
VRRDLSSLCDTALLADPGSAWNSFAPESWLDPSPWTLRLEFVLASKNQGRVMLNIPAVVSIMLCATSEIAQNVYDSTNTMVGPLVGTLGGSNTGLVVTKLNSNYHLLTVTASGLVTRNWPIYYELSSCLGASYLPYNPSTDILPLALFDGHTLWAIDARGAANYSMKSYRTSQGCINYSHLVNLRAAPATATTMMFTGPLSVR